MDLDNHGAHRVLLDELQDLEDHRRGSTGLTLEVALADVPFPVILDLHRCKLSGRKEWLALRGLDGGDRPSNTTPLAFQVAVEAFLGSVIIFHQIIEDPIESLSVPDITTLQILTDAHRPSVLSVRAVLVMVRKRKLLSKVIDGAVGFKVGETCLQRMSLKLSGAEAKGQLADLGKEIFLAGVGERLFL